MTEAIQSERLELIPMTPAFLRASLERNIHEAERLIGITLPTDWPQSDYLPVLNLRLGQIEEDALFQPWSLRAMALRSSREMIGHIGFHTSPGADYLKLFCAEAVEFGFTVFPSFRRLGYAHEASIALMRWAQLTHGVTKFLLSIRTDNTPSQYLARKLGFKRIGSHMDEVDGLEEVLVFDIAGEHTP
jgi:RimJ/RimL family protein N-acetyltransferase